MATLYLPEIDDTNVDQVHNDNIVVTGGIKNDSVVSLVSNNGAIYIREGIDARCKVTLIAEGNIVIGSGNKIYRSKIDNNCKSVRIISRRGSVTIRGKIDNNCSVSIEAGRHIRIGRRINNNCNVSLKAGGKIKAEGYIGNSNVDMDSGDQVILGGGDDAGDNLYNNSNVWITSGDSVTVKYSVRQYSSLDVRAIKAVAINGLIEEKTDVTIDSIEGSITVQGKIDDNCNVNMTAARNVRVGTRGDSDDKHINTKCNVSAQAGGYITVGDKLGDDCYIRFRACGSITIGSVIERGCTAYFETSDQNDVSVKQLRNNDTTVTYWGGDLLTEQEDYEDPTINYEPWIGAPLFCDGRKASGEWWQNWGWKYGYVAENKFLPRNLNELVNFIRNLKHTDRVKAVGGGWSFTDATLPFRTKDSVDFVSIEKRGIGGTVGIRRLLEGAPDSYRIGSFDHQPTTVVRDLQASTSWNQAKLTNEVESAFNLPASEENSSIVDMRYLRGSLQAEFSNIASDSAKEIIGNGRHFFHVEAGITMEHLYTLLDHQTPRLAIQATGGARAATLGGILSTASHGAEFNWPLLIDRVKAIHLVGAGGQQWWIEGTESIASLERLTQIYPDIDSHHFVAGDWKFEECGEEYSAKDVLSAVTVSMGTLGVIYSIVLEVVPAFGLQQRVKRVGDWSELLLQAGVTASQLRNRNEESNRQLLDFILDGGMNGTGIGRKENVYVDLAINPINLDCWITNRRRIPDIPKESKALDFSFGQYENSFRQEFYARDNGIYGTLDDDLIASLMDFFNYGRSLSDVPNVIGQASRLLGFITNNPPLVSTALSVVNAQLTLNEKYRGEPERKREIVGHFLTSFLNVLKGTVQSDVSDVVGPSTEVGATGFTDEGLPGKALEVAMPPSIAFSFLQAMLDRLTNYQNVPHLRSPPLFGYVAIRVCPPSNTLLGMQQFDDYNVMIEPFAFRTPESIPLIQQMMDDLDRWNKRFNAGGMLHWGLENDTLSRDRFERSAVMRPYREGSTTSKLVAFKSISNMLHENHHRVFDNHFVERLGLNDYKCELRRVTSTRKKNGNIIGLCNPNAQWSPVTSQQAIQDICSKGIRYFVKGGDELVFIHVVDSEYGRYLRTSPDAVDINNLDNLPDC